jgi:hypothetical protein
MSSAPISRQSTNFAQFHRPVGIKAVIAAITVGKLIPAVDSQEHGAAVNAAGNY